MDEKDTILPMDEKNTILPKINKFNEQRLSIIKEKYPKSIFWTAPDKINTSIYKTLDIDDVDKLIDYYNKTKIFVFTLHP